MMCRTVCVLLVAAIIGSSFNVNGRLLNTLEDMVVMVNEPTTFSCSSDVSQEIHWRHNDDNYVFAGGKLIGQYKDRLQMKTNITDQSRTYTLVIPSVKPGDAGAYMCREDEGRGDMSSANLIVLSSPLMCTSNMHPGGFIGKNTCNLQEENMTFSCSASFKGRAPPLKWRSSKDHQPISSINCRNQTNQVTCDLTLRPDPKFDGSALICETAVSSKARYNCSTDAIKVQYFVLDHQLKPLEKAINDEVVCSAKSSRIGLPRFTWTFLHNNEETILSTNRSHVIQKAGSYWCHISYDIRGVVCSSLVSVVHAQKHGETVTIALLICLLVIMLTTAIIEIPVFRFCSRERPGGTMEKEFFQLVSQHNRRALTASNTPGAPVVVDTCRNNDDHQLWYEDTGSGTIRSKLNDLCLHIGSDSVLYVKPYENQETQKWTVGNGTVYNTVNNQKVFELCGDQVRASTNYRGETNQKWDAVGLSYVRPDFFYLKSELSGKVLDIEGGRNSAGTKIITWDQKREPGENVDNQLWHEDPKTKILLSKLNNWAIDASGDEIETQRFDPNNRKRSWILHEGFIAQRSNTNQVLDIMRFNPDNGAHLCAVRKHGCSHQKWRVESK